MQHPDEGTIHTWLDGELKADEAAAVEAHVAECGDCSAIAAEARGLVAASSRIVSALDIVPADVIPVRKPINRAWYANTQLRAAAAVLVVAGASFLVLRNGDEPSLSRMLDQRIPATTVTAAANTANVESQKEVAAERAPSSAEKGQARAMSLKAAPSLEPQSPQAPRTDVLQAEASKAESDQQAAAQKDDGRAADASPVSSALRGKVSGAAAPPASVRVASPVAAARMSRAVSPLRVVKSDTTENIVVTVYAVAPELEVTLRETAQNAFAFPGRETARLGTQSGGVSPAPPNEVAPGAVLESITWTNYSTGRTYILSGALSKDELTSLRSRLPSGVR